MNTNEQMPGGTGGLGGGGGGGGRRGERGRSYQHHKTYSYSGKESTTL